MIVGVTELTTSQLCRTKNRNETQKNDSPTGNSLTRLHRHHYYNNANHRPDYTLLHPPRRTIHALPSLTVQLFPRHLLHRPS